MNLPKGHPSHLHDAVAAAYGTKTARAVAAEHGLTTKAVWSIWTRHLASGRLTKLQRPDRDDAVVDAMAAAGRDGLNKAAIGEILGVSSEYATANLKQRLATRGIEIVALRVGRVGRVDVYRYALRPEPPAVDLPCEIRAVPRRVSGDLGLGATPGAVVSVPFVTIIDGARAAGGEGRQ